MIIVWYVLGFFLTGFAYLLGLRYARAKNEIDDNDTFHLSCYMIVVTLFWFVTVPLFVICVGVWGIFYYFWRLTEKNLQGK